MGRQSTEEYEAQQARALEFELASSNAACSQHRTALEKKFGGNIQAKLLEADNLEKVNFLQDIFREFDVDNSGQMDMKEFFLTLRTCGFRVSRAAAMSIMKEVDVDENGTVDIEEFVEFFKKMDDLEAFRYKVQKAQYSSGARKQVVSVYIFVLLAGSFGLLVLDIRNNGRDATVRLIFIVLVVILIASVSAVLLLPIVALKFKPEERFHWMKNQLQNKLQKQQLKKVQPQHVGKVTYVEAVEIPAPPIHGAAANAHEQFSYRGTYRTNRRGGEKLSHRSQDPGFGEPYGSPMQAPSVPALEHTAWESPDAPRVEQDLALVPIDQHEMPSVVQAPSQYRNAAASNTGDQYNFPQQTPQRYAVSNYAAAREMAAREAKHADWARDANFTPWSQSRHRPVKTGLY